MNPIQLIKSFYPFDEAALIALQILQVIPVQDDSISPGDAFYS